VFNIVLITKRNKRKSNAIELATHLAYLVKWVAFQPGQAKDLKATYHFCFTGQEPALATVRIQNQQIKVLPGHAGQSDLLIRADSKTWLQFLAKDYPLAVALLSR